MSEPAEKLRRVITLGTVLQKTVSCRTWAVLMDILVGYREPSLQLQYCYTVSPTATPPADMKRACLLRVMQTWSAISTAFSKNRDIVPDMSWPCLHNKDGFLPIP